MLKQTLARFYTGCRYAALVTLPAAILFVPFRAVRAQFVVTDPGTEANTFVTHVTQLLQYIQEANTALTAFSHFQLMTREVVNLVEHPSINLLQDLAQVQGIIQQSNGLALNLAQMANTFQNQFAPFSPSPLVSFAGQYTQWSKTALQALQGAALSGGYQGNLMAGNGSENQFMQKMGALINQPNGIDQGLQIGNSLSFELIQQLQKLRMIMIQNGASNNAFYTQQLNAGMSAQQAQSTAFAPATVTYDTRTW